MKDIITTIACFIYCLMICGVIKDSINFINLFIFTIFFIAGFSYDKHWSLVILFLILFIYTYKALPYGTIFSWLIFFLAGKFLWEKYFS